MSNKSKASLTTKLFVLLLLPLSGLIYFGAAGAAAKWRVKRDYVVLEGNTAILVQIGNLVHELQKERGRSASYISSKGTLFAQELSIQHGATDAETGKLQTLLKTFKADTFGDSFAEKFKASAATLDSLKEKRQSVLGCQIAASASTAYYTATIAAQLDVIVAMSHCSKDAKINDGISCYVNFLQAKEQAGIERAVLTSTFSLNKFTPDAFTRFSKALAAQETFLRVFENFATEEQRQFYAKTVSGSVVDTVARYRQIAYDKSSTGDFGVVPAQCFDAITEKVNLMKMVEDQLAKDYNANAEEIKNSATRAFLVFSLMTLGLTVVTVGLSIVVIRSIIRPIRAASNALVEGGRETALAVSQVSAASQSIAEGASSQAASFEETSASLEEITTMIKRNSVHADQARELAQQARAAADVGESDLKAMTTAVEAIQSSSAEIAKNHQSNR